MASSQVQTPARVITNKLTRSSPPIPSASQAYDPIVKSVLRHRLIYSIFLYSALFSWTTASFWSIWYKGGVSALGLTGTALVPLLPLTLLSALIIWTTAAVPAAVLRKVFLTPTRTPATSPSTSVKASLSKNSTTHAYVVYSLSAVAAVFLHVFLAYAYKPDRDPKLWLFVKSKKHPYYLNGRLLFILLSQLLTALGFSLRNIMLDRFVFSWSLIASSSNRKSTRFNTSDIVKAIAVAAVFTTLTVPLASIIFGLFRLTLPVIYTLPIVHHLLRPFTAHFLRGSWTVVLPFRHLALLSRAWFLGFTTIFTWELSNGLFDTFIYQPIVVVHVTAEPHVALVSGISSSDPTFRYFAYSELKTLASEQSPTAATRRTALFSDQKHNPSLWAHLIRESLLLLGKDYQFFVHRGKPPPPKPEFKKLEPTPSANAPIKVTQVPLIRASIFQSGKPSSPIRSVVQSLGSDGALAQALDAGAEAAHIPELFRTVEAAVLPEPAKEEVKRSVEKATTIVERLSNQAKTTLHSTFERFAPKWAASFGEQLWVWWRKDRLGRVVQGYLPNMEMDVVVIEVISHLICASLNEDKYGVVQRDIPKVLEAMISFLTEIEKYQKEVRGLYAPPALDKKYTPEEFEELEALRIEVEKASDILGYVGDGLKEGIARIVRTFGDKLLAFKFPTRIAQKLQSFLEYY